MDTIDNKLIEKYIGGDATVFTELVARNIGLIYRYAFRMSQDSEEASDITQETFVKIWRNIHKFDVDKNFRVWVLGIAHNTAIDFLRKRKNLVFSDFDIEDGGNSITDILTDTAPLPPDIFEQSEKAELLQKALEKISTEQREVLILHYEEGLTFSEMSDILKKPLNTVKSQHRRAILSLRRILDGLS